MIRAILHVDKKWGIGKKNTLMFSLPLDMKFFRETTSGHTVVLGENTLKSFPGGKPLKNRRHIVLSPGAERDDCEIVRNLEEAKAAMRRAEEDGEDVYVIGGASVYRQLLPYCGEVYVTKVDADGGADTFFPNLDVADDEKNFSCVKKSEPQEDNGYIIPFCTYKNNAPLPL